MEFGVNFDQTATKSSIDMKYHGISMRIPATFFTGRLTVYVIILRLYFDLQEKRNLTGSNESLATLKLLNLTERSNGKYKCEASNAFGKAEYEFVLKVKGEFDFKFICHNIQNSKFKRTTTFKAQVLLKSFNFYNLDRKAFNSKTPYILTLDDFSPKDSKKKLNLKYIEEEEKKTLRK